MASFARLRDGSWGLRGSEAELVTGQMIEVEKVDGTVRHVRVGTIVAGPFGDGNVLATLADAADEAAVPTPPPAGGSSAQEARRARRQAQAAPTVQVDPEPTVAPAPALEARPDLRSRREVEVDVADEVVTTPPRPDRRARRAEAPVFDREQDGAAREVPVASSQEARRARRGARGCSVTSCTELAAGGLSTCPVHTTVEPVEEPARRPAPTIRSGESLERVTAAGAGQKGVATLGCLVWWSAEGAEALRTDVEAAVEAVGLDPAVCPSIEPRGGLRKALEAAGLRASPQSGKRAAADESARLFYDRLVDDATSIVFAVSEREVVDGAAGPKAVYHERQVVTYDRATRSISMKTSFMEGELHEGFKKYCETYRANELRVVLQNVLDQASAVRVKDGLYFVPAVLMEKVEKLKALTQKLDRVSLTRVSILDVAGERDDLRAVAGQAILGELVALQGDLQNVAAAQADGTSVREGTLTGRLARFAELREKARVYQDLLAIETRDIETGLDALTVQVEGLLTKRRQAAQGEGS